MWQHKVKIDKQWWYSRESRNHNNMSITCYLDCFLFIDNFIIFSSFFFHIYSANPNPFKIIPLMTGITTFEYRNIFQSPPPPTRGSFSEFSIPMTGIALWHDISATRIMMLKMITFIPVISSFIVVGSSRRNNTPFPFHLSFNFLSRRETNFELQQWVGFDLLEILQCCLVIHEFNLLQLLFWRIY